MNEQELIKQVREQQDAVVKEYQELYVNVQGKNKNNN